MPTTTRAGTPVDANTLAAARRAGRLIPPLWPLASSVAVNPFLGQADEPLATAAARLRRAAGVAGTMPRSWYAARLGAGEISDADLGAAVAAAPTVSRDLSVDTIKAAAARERPTPKPLPSVADLAAAASGTDWPGVLAERIGHWAASYFDRGQALWAAPEGRGTYDSWRTFAVHDLTPEIVGLKGFATLVARFPETGEEAIASAVERLGLPTVALDAYFHRLLTTLGGWAQLARHRVWEAELSGGSDSALTDVLAIRLAWETALLAHYAADVRTAWRDAIAAFAEPIAPSLDDRIDSILQDATERAAQRQLGAVLAQPSPARPAARAMLQAAFCIDVRSEVFRRALESLDPGIQTLGFAGFFGLRVAHRRFASDVAELRLPVLLTPTLTTCAGDHAPATVRRAGKLRLAARARRAWGRFRLAAVSSFAFVEATGPIYVGKLLRDGLGLAGKAMPADPAPEAEPPLALEARTAAAEGILRAMSLTGGFARLVVIAGHGSTTVNNPHASALNCGACGGYSGDVNARLLAALLNDREVRAGLEGRGIAIPSDTLFIAALHDTVTDRVTLYGAGHAPDHSGDIARGRRWLAAAGGLARGERALRLPRAAAAADVPGRARDWAEVRPEWALAGCQAFIAAPRARTAGRDLGGRAFLHDYDWRQDGNFAVLETILTAPVVVASWISLQYYGSTVAPELFGAGNKLLHNVTGGIGVVEGNGGLLRGGLPWQSVHDGARLMHEPLRLSVLVEAPRAAISAILERNPSVRALFDHRWLHLFTLDESGRMAWRYAGGLSWEPVADHVATEPEQGVPA